MWPEAWTYADLARLLLGPERQRSSVGLPLLLREQPRRFPYLLPGGCRREGGGARAKRFEDVAADADGGGGGGRGGKEPAVGTNTKT